MQRELKFRVWDKENTELFGFNNQRGAFFIRSDGILERQVASVGGMSPNGEMVYCSTNYPLSKDRFIIQQYTGLKDKNGKDIYEGDIVKRLYRLEPTVYDFGTVNFGIYEDDEGYGTENHYGYFIKFNASRRHEGASSYEYTATLIDIHDKMEIAGNIFETPELLDKNA